MYYVCMGRKWYLVKKIGKARILIGYKDHNPPHVNVIAPGANAIINVQTWEAKGQGFNKATLNKLIKFLQSDIKNIMEVWDEAHKED